MKKFIVCLLIFLAVAIICVLIPKKEETSLKKVKVAEVAHSIFYVPWYSAHSLGYFEEEGLDVEIILASGADKVTAAILSNDVEIGFCGTEATMYVYLNGEPDYLVNFSGLTKKDGSFLVSRTKYDNFNLNNLKGKYVIGGRKAGMPEMTFEWALRKNGINPQTDLTIDTSVAFAAMSGSFIGGTGDFVTLFEPNATEIEKQGLGYIVASVGEYGGDVPYTAFNARKSYIENNPYIINGFKRAIQKGLDYTHNTTSVEIAKTISNYFPDTDIKDLETIIDRYKSIDAWYKTTDIGEEEFNHIQEIVESAGELNSRVPYDKLVKNN